MPEAPTDLRPVESMPGEQPLPDARQREFDRHASRLGHDPSLLRGEAELVSYPRVESVAGLRALAAATPVQRGLRQRVFFSPTIEVRRSLGQGVHDRLEAAIFADGRIDPADEARGAAHFPFPTRTLSVRHKTVRAPECWDLSVRGERWGLDDRDDIMNVVNVGDLRIEPSATIVVRGNLLILIIGQLTCEPGEGGVPYHLAILPTPFSVDGDTGPADGAAGPPGQAGGSGGHGRATPTVATWLGARLAGPVVPGAADGLPGAAGTAGGDGGRGRTGGASKIAEITIGDLVGSLTVLAAAGRGGDGGPGGSGAPGGAGGHGAPGQRTLRGVLPPGRGGDGGPGGDGGKGGRGGHGGISSNVFLSVPAAQARQVRVLAHPSGGGRSGNGGPGAPGGAAGQGGLSAEPGASASGLRADGRRGQAGAAGNRGRDGRPRPAPPVYVNERAPEPMPAPAELPPPPATVWSLDTRLSALTGTGTTTGTGEAQ